MKFAEVGYNGKSYTVPVFSVDSGVHLTPKQKTIAVPQDSLVLQEMDTVWDLASFKQPHTPIDFGEVSDAAKRDFMTDSPVRTLDMPIKFPGTDYRLPAELGYLAKAVQECIDAYHSVHPNPDRGYCYLTFDFGMVKKGVLQREAAVHVDGFQGPRRNPPVVVNNSITIASAIPTIYYPQPFDFDALDITRHNFFFEMNRQVAAVNSEYEWSAPDWHMALMNAYCAHRGGQAPVDTYRHWLRLSWEDWVFDRLGNAHNPLFDYDWKMVRRDIEQLNLEVFAADADPSLGRFPHEALDGSSNPTGQKTQPNLRPYG